MLVPQLLLLLGPQMFVTIIETCDVRCLKTTRKTHVKIPTPLPPVVVTTNTNKSFIILANPISRPPICRYGCVIIIFGNSAQHAGPRPNLYGWWTHQPPPTTTQSHLRIHPFNPLGSGQPGWWRPLCGQINDGPSNIDIDFALRLTPQPSSILSSGRVNFWCGLAQTTTRNINGMDKTCDVFGWS